MVLNVPAGILSPALIAMCRSPLLMSVAARRRGKLQIVHEALVAARGDQVERRSARVVLLFQARAATHQILRGFLAGRPAPRTAVASRHPAPVSSTATPRSMSRPQMPVMPLARGVMQHAVAGVVAHLDVGAAFDEPLRGTALRRISPPAARGVSPRGSARVDVGARLDGFGDGLAIVLAHGVFDRGPCRNRPTHTMTAMRIEECQRCQAVVTLSPWS